MKQFVKALPKDGQCFQYLCDKFPHLSDAKKKGVFVGPDIRTLMLDSKFELKMTLAEKEAWVSFKVVITKFLGNTRDSDYIGIIGNMLEKFKKIGCLMSLKINFLQSPRFFSRQFW